MKDILILICGTIALSEILIGFCFLIGYLMDKWEGDKK